MIEISCKMLSAITTINVKCYWFDGVELFNAKAAANVMRNSLTCKKKQQRNH